MPVAVRYHRLPTERRHPRSRSLDRLSTSQLLRLMHQEDLRAVLAVRSQLPQIGRAVHLIEQALRRRRRLFFVGAGTSGRLGVIEAAECPPTFHTAPNRIQALIAGGDRAVFRSREGAEDDRTAARRAIQRRVRRGDVVVGITASGVTPFVEAALRVAQRRGAKTVLITCHAGSAIAADVRIAVAVGPEVLTGSTRLKAGTATKLVLNMLTLGAMVRLGKTYGDLMVDVRPTSSKLQARAWRIIQLAARVSEREAARCLRAARGDVNAAILIASDGCSLSAARRRLAASRGSLHQALSTPHSLARSLTSSRP